MTRVKRRRAFGSAMTEYALPVVGILIVGGVLASTMDLNQHLGSYFIKASGQDKSALQGSTLKAAPVGSGAKGETSSGSDGFDSFGRLSDGAGNAIKLGGRNYVYSGPIAREVRPQGLGANGDKLYSDQEQKELYEQAVILLSQGASAEYVARVLQLAALTEQAGNYKIAGNSNLISMLTASQQGQLGSLNAYAAKNLDEVLAHGGLMGLAQVNLAASRSIDSGVDIGEFYGKMKPTEKTGKNLETLKNTITDLQKKSGKEDIDLNSPEIKDALQKANLNEADYGALAEFLANIGALNMTNQVGEGLVNESAATSYVSDTYAVSMPAASADYSQSLITVSSSSIGSILVTTGSGSSSSSTSVGTLSSDQIILY